MVFDVFSYTNHGGRSYNEDHVGHNIIGDNGIFVVADGLGGHSFGEVASQCVVDTLVQNFDGNFSGNAGNYLSSAAAIANDAVVSIQKEKNETLKSTVVALAIDEGNATWMNVGDSRLYYFHRGALRAYTNDHSVAYKKYKGGEITREQLCHDEDQSALLRSIGNPEGITPELYGNGTALEEGDAFLLCSDGAWEYLVDDEILIDLMKSSSAKEWAERLLLRIIDRVDGGHDNLSVMTICIGGKDMSLLPKPEMNGLPSTDDAHSIYVLEDEEMTIPPVNSVISASALTDAASALSPDVPPVNVIPQKSNKKLIAVVVSVVALILIAFIVVLIIFLSKKNEKEKISDQNETVVEENEKPQPDDEEGAKHDDGAGNDDSYSPENEEGFTPDGLANPEGEEGTAPDDSLKPEGDGGLNFQPEDPLIPELNPEEDPFNLGEPSEEEEPEPDVDLPPSFGEKIDTL